jgi:Fe-S cluster biogenesis protein NfuA
MHTAFLAGPAVRRAVWAPLPKCCPSHARLAPRTHTSACAPGVARTPAAAPALEDRDVPTAHRGLHDTLYAGGAEAEHAAESRGGNAAAATAAATTSLFVDPVGATAWDRERFLRETDGQKVAGVYGVLDARGELVYVGFSRNISLALKGHVGAVGTDAVHSVRVRTFGFPKKAEMEHVRDEWIAQNGTVPPGNRVEGVGGVENPWSATATMRQVARSAMSEQERLQFEEKKFKLRKAMADPALADELDEAEREEAAQHDDVSSTAEMRRKLRLAVEGDDWSGEVDAQTAGTLPQPNMESRLLEETARDKPSAAVAEDATIISPFAGQSVLGEPTVHREEMLALTAENVDRVLDEVRPYLLSDGGNISVVSIALPETVTETAGGQTVTLQLEGACGTCPSSTMTMQLGVERVLREKFGEAIGEVIAISDPAAALKSELSVEACERALDEVRPSVTAFGGNMNVISAAAGKVQLQYSGPPKLAYAIEHLLKEKVPNVQTVLFT